LIKVFINFLARIIYNFRETEIFTRSGSFAFTVLLSFVPFTIAMVGIISYLPVPDATIIKIQHLIFTDYLPPAAGDQIYHQVKIFLHQSRRLSLFGFIPLLFTTYMMIYAIEQQLNAILNNKQKRKLGHSLLTYTFFLICGIVLSILVSILQLSSLVSFFSSNIVTLLNQSISIIITTLLLALMYKLIPHHKTTFKHALIAATAATVSLILIKILFIHVLVKIFVNYHIIYGSLSFIPIFLLWVYISCINLFFCAGIIYALETKFNRELQRKIDEFIGKWV
jgi:membrane protein